MCILIAQVVLKENVYLTWLCMTGLMFSRPYYKAHKRQVFKKRFEN